VPPHVLSVIVVYLLVVLASVPLLRVYWRSVLLCLCYDLLREDGSMVGQHYATGRAV